MQPTRIKMVKHIPLPILACMGIISGLQAADAEAR